MNCDVTNLIARIVEKGDSEAYGEIVTGFSNAAFAVAVSILGNREDARDITQDAFVMAYEMLPDLRDRSKFAVWLKRIVSGLSRNLLRDRKRRVAAHAASAEKAALFVRDALVHAEQREEDEIVYSHIQALPERHRTVIIMKYIEDMRYGDIAAFLEISPRTAKSLAFEAKHLLLVHLAKQGITAPTMLQARIA
jgi:RNA polymerase sigma-70 factor (ECF subfamily)